MKQVIFSLRELAMMIGISKKRTYHMLSRNNIPNHRVGNRLQYHLSDLVAKMPSVVDSMAFKVDVEDDSDE